MARPLGRLTLPQQALGLRHVFPTAKTVLLPMRLIWAGTVTPTPLSRDYRIRISYSVGHFPSVVVLDPPLKPDADGRLPHFFRNDTLCLHEAHEWDDSMQIVDTIVPWASEWLAHYELWTRNGRWFGDGHPQGETQSTQPAGVRPGRAAMNRAGRRQGARNERRSPSWGALE